MEGDVGQIGEKRWVAAVMVDICGSTALTARVGAEEAFGVVRRLVRAIAEELEAEGGYVIDTAGDSVLAVFGAPSASETAALDASNAAFNVLHRIEKENGPDVRIGIAGGPVFVASLGLLGENRIHALGDPVNLASRLQGLAPDGAIYASQAFAEEVEGYVQTELAGTHDFKGLSEPQAVFQLIRVTDVAALSARIARGAGLFVGRDDDLGRLLNWVTGTDAASCYVLHGPPGIGKSRLVKTLLEQLPQGLPVRFVTCEPHDESTALGPVAKLIREDMAHDRADDVEAWLASRLRDGARTSEQLLSLLTARTSKPVGDIPGTVLQARKQIAALLRSILAPGRLVVIEDAHWLDPLSCEVLSDLIRQTEVGSRILLTSRIVSPLKASAMQACRVVALPRLSDAETAQIAQAMLGGEETSDARVSELIARRAEGIPLFAEELSRHADALQDMESTESIDHIGSIRTLVFSRFDKFSPQAKSAFRVLAVIGRNIVTSDVDAATGDGDATASILSEGRDGGIIEASADGHRFSHALFRDAILASIPASQLPSLRERAAKIILAGGAERARRNAADLGAHFEAAGNTSEAIRHYYVAAEAAWQVYSLKICREMLMRAEVLVEPAGESLDDQLLEDLAMLHVKCLDVFGIFAEQNEVAQVYIPRLKQLSSPRALLYCRTLWAKTLGHLKQQDEAKREIDDVIEEAGAQGDTFSLALARAVKMRILNDSQFWSEAEVDQLFEQSKEGIGVGDDGLLKQMRLYELMASRRRAGRLINAQELSHELIAMGKRDGDARATTSGYWALAVIGNTLSDHEMTIRSSVASKTFAVPGSSDWYTAHVFELGARIMSGDKRVEVAELEEMARVRERNGDVTMCLIASFFRVLALFVHGRVRDASAAFDETEVKVRNTKDPQIWVAYVLAKAEILMTFAGLRPSTLPPPKLGFLDILAAIGLKISAVRKTRELLDGLDVWPGRPDGVFGARYAMLRALLAKRDGKPDEAKAEFANARQVLERENAEVFLDLLRKMET